VAALAALKLDHGAQQVGAAEVGPKHRGDPNLGIGDLPKQEVAEPHFPAGADDQVGIGQRSGIEMALQVAFGDLQLIETALGAGFVHQRLAGIHQFRAGAIVERQGEAHAGVGGGGGAGSVEVAAHLLRQLGQAADGFEPDVLPVELLHLGAQEAAQQGHQEVDLGAGALPVLGGEGVEGEGGNVQAGRGLDRGADRLHPGAVAGDTGQVALMRPAAVAVHGDTDVARQAAAIHLAPELGFRAVHGGPGEGGHAYFSLSQAITSSTVTTPIIWWCSSTTGRASRLYLLKSAATSDSERSRATEMGSSAMGRSSLSGWASNTRESGTMPTRASWVESRNRVVTFSTWPS